MPGDNRMNYEKDKTRDEDDGGPNTKVTGEDCTLLGGGNFPKYGVEDEIRSSKNA